MKTRWARDNRILLAIGVALGLCLSGLYALVLKARALSPAAATSQVLLFVLFYIVVVLILALVFVLLRNALKLLLEARRGVFGSRFRVRVVATHIGLALLPISLLILPTTRLLERSVELWFAPPVEATIRTGRSVSELVKTRAAELERRTALRLAGPLSRASTDSERLALLAAARESSGLEYMEWRPIRAPSNTPPVTTARWPVQRIPEPSAAWIEDARQRGFARRIEEIADGAQISRTVFALEDGLLIVGTYDPPAEARDLRALAQATSAYDMLRAERASILAIQTLFFLLLAFLVLLASVWAGLLLARRVTRPIAALAASARRVGGGDFDARVEVEGDDEIASLSSTFNAMTNELRRGREELERANAGLAETNHRLDEERRRIRAVLAHLDTGVVAFRMGEAQGSGESAEPEPHLRSAHLVALNERAREILGCPTGASPTTLGELFLDDALGTVRAFFAQAGLAGGRRETTLGFTPPGAENPRTVEIRVAAIEPGSFVATLEDTTALVKAERAAAWEEAARRVAHEIKNPLTPIRLAAERMRRRARALAPGISGEVQGLASIVEEGASAIVEEVGTLNNLVDAFGRFARLPPADLAEVDLAAIVSQVVTLFGETKSGVRVRARLNEAPLTAMADAEQIKRALVNLVDNAVAATPPGGEVVVDAAVRGDSARLAVTDDGPGIPTGQRSRVFEPAFSTKPRGTGLGLAITSRIAVEHRGRVLLEENVPRGCRFVLEWPAGVRAAGMVGARGITRPKAS